LKSRVGGLAALSWDNGTQLRGSLHTPRQVPRPMSYGRPTSPTRSRSRPRSNPLANAESTWVRYASRLVNGPGTRRPPRAGGVFGSRGLRLLSGPFPGNRSGRAWGRGGDSTTFCSPGSAPGRRGWRPPPCGTSDRAPSTSAPIPQRARRVSIAHARPPLQEDGAPPTLGTPPYRKKLARRGSKPAPFRPSSRIMRSLGRGRQTCRRPHARPSNAFDPTQARRFGNVASTGCARAI
jgi:hypothetical protein